jgi:hypothetical protein
MTNEQFDAAYRALAHGVLAMSYLADQIPPNHLEYAAAKPPE